LFLRSRSFIFPVNSRDPLYTTTCDRGTPITTEVPASTLSCRDLIPALGECADHLLTSSLLLPVWNIGRRTMSPRPTIQSEPGFTSGIRRGATTSPDRIVVGSSFEALSATFHATKNLSKPAACRGGRSALHCTTAKARNCPRIYNAGVSL
jgi:hypothetical protein